VTPVEAATLSCPRWEKARSLNSDRAFDAHVAGQLYAQPLYWHVSGSNMAILLVATEDEIVHAFDATTGRELWRRSVGTPVKSSLLPCGNINPLGITGTPVIDPVQVRRFILTRPWSGQTGLGTKFLDYR
jgi:outer membrane protein assembly factor BamB